MLTLEAKSTVNWDVCTAIEAAQPTIARVYQDVKAKAVVTSARDSDHSKKTAHSTGRAIDLRITSLFRETAGILRAWYERILAFAHDLAIALEQSGIDGVFYLVLERDHIHLEWAPKGTPPNIKGWKPEQHVYIHPEVKVYLAPKVTA